jgi:hypothetical protein
MRPEGGMSGAQVEANENVRSVRVCYHSISTSKERESWRGLGQGMAVAATFCQFDSSN